MITNILVGTPAMYNRAVLESPGFADLLKQSSRLVINRDDETLTSIATTANLIGIYPLSVNVALYGKLASGHLPFGHVVPLNLKLDYRILGTSAILEIQYPVQISIVSHIENSDLAAVNVDLTIGHPTLKPIHISLQWPPLRQHIRGASWAT